MLITLLTLLVMAGAFYLVVLYYAFVGVYKVYDTMTGYLTSYVVDKPSFVQRGKVEGIYKKRQVICTCVSTLFKPFHRAWDNFEVRMRTNVDLRLQKGYFVQIRPTVNTFADNNWVVYLLSDVGERRQERLMAALEELCQAAEKYEQQVKERVHQKCLACGQELGAGQEVCPECGWSWKGRA